MRLIQFFALLGKTGLECMLLYPVLSNKLPPNSLDESDLLQFSGLLGVFYLTYSVLRCSPHGCLLSLSHVLTSLQPSIWLLSDGRSHWHSVCFCDKIPLTKVNFRKKKSLCQLIAPQHSPLLSGVRRELRAESGAEATEECCELACSS